MTSILRLVTAAAAAALLSTAAFASDMDAYFGGTLVMKDSKGVEMSRSQFNQDGTYTTTRKNGKNSAGKWRMQGAAICTTEGASDEEDCVDLQLGGKKAGDAWSVSNGGVTLELTLLGTR